MADVNDIELPAGAVFPASRIRTEFQKQRAGKGIETLQDENGTKYIRLFSSPDSEYGDDLEADPMRYVGEKDFNNPEGDQVPKWGNGALIESTSSDIPIFLLEKVSENPVEYFYYGRVEVVDFEHNFRPQKGKKEYDFYIKQIDASSSDTSRKEEKESEDDLSPNQLQEIDPERREVPDTEETIEYESEKQKQAQSTNEHEATVAELSSQLGEECWECHKTQETDILGSRDSEALVVEVKSINGENDGAQIRKAMGQVFENSYRDVRRRGWGEKTLTQCLAFSQTPHDQYSGYLEFLREQGIEILWKTEEGISGHPDSVSKLGLE